MKVHALGILILVTCSSCAVYQQNLLRSNINGDAKDPFRLENDTLMLRYSFHDGICTIDIYNKSYVPLYIDWSRCVRIVDGYAHAYWNEQINWDTKPVSFIPPNSRIVNMPFNIRALMPPVVPEVNGNTTVTIRYLPHESPLQFRSYLLLSYDPYFEETFSYDHEFWLAATTQSRQPVELGKPHVFITTNLEFP